MVTRFSRIIHSFVLVIAGLWVFGPVSASAVPLRELPQLSSITFWERTASDPNTGFFQYTFDTNSSALLERLPTLSANQNDFEGVVGRELYDVFYSDADGTADANGEYVTIEAVYDAASPAGGGLNISEVVFNFAGAPARNADFLASFHGLGDNYIAGSEEYAIDGNLQTHTTMGSNIGTNDRMRITVGLNAKDQPVPEPASMLLLGLGLFGAGALRHRS